MKTGDSERMDFTDDRLPTLNIGHPVFMNYRGEEVSLPSGTIEYLLGELEALEKEVDAYPPSPDSGLMFLKEIYRIVDRLGKVIGPGMACSTGCSACCRVMVATTRVEAELLGERVRERSPPGAKGSRGSRKQFFHAFSEHPKRPGEFRQGR